MIEDNIEKATVIDEMAKHPSAMLRSVQMLSAIAGNRTIYLFISPGIHCCTIWDVKGTKMQKDTVI